LYEDDGESFRYRQGNFTRIVCDWKDADRALTLHVDPKGKPAAGRKLQVEIAGGTAPKTVTLRGATTEVKL